MGRLGTVEIDLIHFQQSEIALAFLGGADASRDRVAGAQTEAPDLAGRDVNVIRTGQIGTVPRTQEAVAVLQDLHHAISGNLIPVLGGLLEDREDDVLFAGAGGAFDIHRLSQSDKLGCGHFFQVGQIHARLLRGRSALGLEGLNGWREPIRGFGSVGFGNRWSRVTPGLERHDCWRHLFSLWGDKAPCPGGGLLASGHSW